MVFPELSIHVVAAMFLASLLLLAQGQHIEKGQGQEDDRPSSSHRTPPKGIGLMILKQMRYDQLLPLVLNAIHRQRPAKVHEESTRSYPRDIVLETLLSKRFYPRRRMDTKRAEMVAHTLRNAPARSSHLLDTEKDVLRQRRKRAKMLINNLAALFSDLRGGGSKGSLIMPSLRIG